LYEVPKLYEQQAGRLQIAKWTLQIAD